MINFIGKLLGSEKAVGAVVNAVSSGLDKLRYTSEEKAENDFKIMQEQANIRLRAQEQIIEWQKATTGQNVTRRVIALLIVGIWASTYLVRMIMLVVGVFWESMSDRLIVAANLIERGISDIEPHMMTVLAFYFALGGIVDGVKSYRDLKGAKNG